VPAAARFLLFLRCRVEFHLERGKALVELMVSLSAPWLSIQVHMQGPFAVTYVNSADDPSRKHPQWRFRQKGGSNTDVNRAS
jgi:hypothetical protein